MLQQPEAASPAGYRRDIDGLRAVAVLLVLASHLETKPLGGYIGVDVFFVISGYLISASILSDMQAGRFSIAAFYERRIRRIFPAMLAMLLVTTALAWHYLLPAENVLYAQSLLASIASGSNFLFWHEGGYFDLPATIKPLLHTWSLSVEEQFYVLFPLFLVAMRRWLPGSLKRGIVTISLLSLLAACFTVPNHDVAAFFFAPLRAWELLIGTILSQRYLPALRSVLSRELAGGIGLALILVPAFLYTTDTAFPGLTAIPPCLGAALIIAAGETGTSLAGRLLSLPPIRFIGLISYSLYLWHWPLIVFQENGALIVPENTPRRLMKLVVVLVSIAVATLSWKFVEQPFRAGRWRPNRRQLFASAAIASGALAAVGAAMLAFHGMPNRLPPDARSVAALLEVQPHAAGETCFLQPDNTFDDFNQRRCLAAVQGKPSILIAGDSHANMLMPGLTKAFAGDTLMQATASNCPALVVPSPGRNRSRNCVRLFDFLFNDFLIHHHVDTLVLAARWRDTDLPGIAATVAWTRAHGIHTVIIGPGIEFDTSPPRLIAFALRDGTIDQVPTHEMPFPRVLDARMATLARDVWHVPYISIYDDLCKPACPLFADDHIPILGDGNHLSPSGSYQLAQAIRAANQLP
jgi:peptidoglycan/LPS O-acetylase OafA/YrhL